MDAFYLVKNMLKSIVPVEDITFKDTESYFSVLHKGKTTRWICRFYFNTANKYLVVPDENKKEIKLPITGIYDIDNYKEKIVTSLSRFL